MKKFLLILLGICFTSSLSLCAQQAKKEKGMVTEELAGPKMYVVHNVLYIEDATAGSKLQIFTIVGNKVYEIEIQTPNITCELSLLQLPKALYIFKLDGLVRKIVIK